VRSKDISKKNNIESNQSAIFSSKVPNCKDMKNEKADLPGPGDYDPRKVNLDLTVDNAKESSKILENTL
jgi:hypothetical protein